VALSLSAVLSTIYGRKHAATLGPDAPALVAVLAGASLGVLFVRRQRSIAYPLLDVALFRRPAFSATVAAYALSCLAMFGVYIFIAQHLQLVLGLSPLEAGVAILPWSLGFVSVRCCRRDWRGTCRRCRYWCGAWRSPPSASRC
jgi:MFS transporter, DHA2 family, multidrug resistance protein